jgi:radical SAM protein (TIGR01212 family)
MEKRYNDLNSYLRRIFGCRVQKITVDAGLSCPNRDGTVSTGGCIYCNARGSGTGAFMHGRSITEQLEAGKTVLSKRYKAKKFIAYFQSFSNTYAPADRLEALYQEALSVEDIVGLSVGTRPDCVSPEILDLLEGIACKRLVWVEYGLQSAHDSTLLRINRGHDLRCFESAVEATKNRGIKQCVHIILGLPGEDRNMMLATADRISRMGIDGIKIHLLYVIKNTPMEALFRRGLYRCLDQQEYAELVCDVLERIPESMIVQRLTGDPHPEELAAPEWALGKTETLAIIDRRLEERGTWQGRRLTEHRTSNIQRPTSKEGIKSIR